MDHLARRKPIVAVLVLGVLVGPLVASVLVAALLVILVLAFNLALTDPVEWVEIASGALPTLYLASTYSLPVGAIFGIPITLVMTLLAHGLTERRPVDGLRFGAAAGFFPMLVLILLYGAGMLWLAIPATLVGGALGWLICRFGYHRT